MYNRYIPQPDGTYRRNAVPDPASQQRQPPQREEPRRSEPVVPSCPPEMEIPPCQQGQPCAHMRAPHRAAPQQPRQSRPTQPQGLGNFFRQLLPKDFDTEDLIIVLLLLLMAGDSREDQNSALLTLALYLFM